MSITLILLMRKLRYKRLSSSATVTLLVSGRARVGPDSSVFASDPPSVAGEMAGPALALKTASSSLAEFLNFWQNKRWHLSQQESHCFQ